MNIHHQSPKTSPRIVCIGMPVRDLIFRVPEVPARGQKEYASEFVEVAGGNSPNAAISISRLGGRVLLTGPIGGLLAASNAIIDDQFRSEGIDTSGLVVVDGVVTPISSVLIDPSGERTIATFRDPKLWTVTLPPLDTLLADCDAILIESRCAEFGTDVCAEAHRRGIPVVIDGDRIMSMREGLLQVASHIIFSTEALRATAGESDDIAALRRLAQVTPAFLGVTSGARGVEWLDERGEPKHMPAFPVHTVDTLGAGDAFHGAFTLAVAEGQPLEQAMRFASATAALKCTRFGGAFGSPERAEVDTLLASSTVALPA
ncbi:MAG: sugar kinase [Afipia sp.]|nr:sugar kinase [Afipia sp.]MBS4003748.1 sugar kinase [Afipia sp.]WIG53819.1 MAG: PfkB [Afipia sp.]